LGHILDSGAVDVRLVRGVREGWLCPLAVFAPRPGAIIAWPPSAHGVLTLNAERRKASRLGAGQACGEWRLSLNSHQRPAAWRFPEGGIFIHVYIAAQLAEPDGAGPQESRSQESRSQASCSQASCLHAADPDLGALVLDYAHGAQTVEPVPGTAEMNARAQLIARRLHPHLGASPHGRPAPLPSNVQTLVLRQIEARIDAKLPVPVLAALAGMSEGPFARAFRATFGITPHRYVLERRVARAVALLADPRRPLAEIALEVGFSSQAHLTETFRRFAGLSPRRMRALLQRPGDGQSQDQGALGDPACGCACAIAAVE
jgi:AraC-like DNA-binding protein